MLGLMTILALASPADDPEPRYSGWVNDYHHLAIDCDFVTHSFGRNAAWGLWRIPFEQVDWAISEPRSDGDLILTLTCRNGTDCIQKGALDATPERIGRHEVPFKSQDMIEGFPVALMAVETGCAVAEVEARQAEN